MHMHVQKLDELCLFHIPTTNPPWTCAGLYGGQPHLGWLRLQQSTVKLMAMTGLFAGVKITRVVSVELSE